MLKWLCLPSGSRLSACLSPSQPSTWTSSSGAHCTTSLAVELQKCACCSADCSPAVKRNLEHCFGMTVMLAAAREAHCWDWIGRPTHVKPVLFCVGRRFLSTFSAAHIISCCYTAPAFSEPQIKTCRDTAGEEEYALHIDLYGDISPDDSRWELLSTKIEIRLKKTAAGVWPRLDQAERDPSSTAVSAPEPVDSRRSYPTSTRRCAPAMGSEHLMLHTYGAAHRRTDAAGEGCLASSHGPQACSRRRFWCF